MSIVPSYHRVFLALREQILNGACDWRSPMPSELELSAEHAVSRGTVRRALSLLEEEGLVERRQGARTYPKPLGYRAANQRRNLDLVGRETNHLEIFAGDIDQHYEIVEPDKELSRQFPGQNQLGRVVRVREAQAKPYCFVVTYMPLLIADSIDWENLGSTPVITATAEAGYDFVKTEQVITATIANEASAAALQVAVGSPVLQVSGLFIDANENAVMRKDGYFHPEGFEYRTTLYKTTE
jgi:GntR family transcriptional regulator